MITVYVDSLSIPVYLLKIPSRAVLNNLGETVSPCLTPLSILILLLSLWSLTVDVPWLYTVLMILM